MNNRMSNATSTLRIHKYLPSTTVEGPGTRACIWVQGCPIQCDGCAVPWTWSTESGVEESIENLARQIINGPEIEGITFLGGEPFAQAEGVVELAKILKNEGLSIMTFTGYQLENIQRSNRKAWQELIAITDFLIDGPFEKDKVDFDRPWVGSKNQRYHFLSDRYCHLETELSIVPNQLEIHISSNGILSANGMASMKLINALLSNT